MSNLNRGFTIVEIITVIATLSILAAITLISWNMVTDWSRDQANKSDIEAWSSNFDNYKSRYFVYPVMPTNSTTPAIGCLGEMTSASSDRCGVFANMGLSFSDSTGDALLTEMEKIGDAPKNSSQVIIDTFAGPMYYVTQSSDTPPYTVTANLFGYFKQGCPDDFTDVSSTVPYSTYIPSGMANGTKICNLQKSFVFDPS